MQKEQALDWLEAMESGRWLRDVDRMLGVLERKPSEERVRETEGMR